MLIDSKIVQYIRPDSETDSDAEAYEYYLVWQAPDGGIYSWLFEDFETRLRIKGTVINTKSDNITKLYDNASQSVELIAEDLTENEVDVISDILRAKIIRRYFRDSTFQNLAIDTDSFRKQKSDNRYAIELTVIELEKPLLK